MLFLLKKRCIDTQTNKQLE